MTGSKPTGKVNYLIVDQVEELHSRILDLTGGEHGDLSRSNLEYMLEGVKDVGRRLETSQAIMKRAAYLLYNFVVQHPFVNGNKRTALELCNSLPQNEQLRNYRNARRDLQVPIRYRGRPRVSRTG